MLRTKPLAWVVFVVAEVLAGVVVTDGVGAGEVVDEKAVKAPTLPATLLVDGRGGSGVVGATGVGLPAGGALGRARASSAGARTVSARAEPRRDREKSLGWAIVKIATDFLPGLRRLTHISRHCQTSDAEFLSGHKTVLEIVPPAHAHNSDRAPWCSSEHIRCQ